MNCLSGKLATSHPWRMASCYLKTNFEMKSLRGGLNKIAAHCAERANDLVSMNFAVLLKLFTEREYWEILDRTVPESHFCLANPNNRPTSRKSPYGEQPKTHRPADLSLSSRWSWMDPVSVLLKGPSILSHSHDLSVRVAKMTWEEGWKKGGGGLWNRFWMQPQLVLASGLWLQGVEVAHATTYSVTFSDCKVSVVLNFPVERSLKLSSNNVVLNSQGIVFPMRVPANQRTSETGREGKGGVKQSSVWTSKRKQLVVCKVCELGAFFAVLVPE